MNLAQFLVDSARRIPGHLAIRYRDQRVTYGQFDRLVNGLAANLAKAGLQPGQVCVLMMPNSVDWAVCYYALAKLGAVVLPVNFLYRTAELEHIFRDSGARAFIGPADHLEYAGPVLNRMPAIDIRLAAGAAVQGFEPLAGLIAEQDDFPLCPTADDDTLAIIYTSGTTGLPKGAMLTHRNLASNAQTVADMRRTEPGDVVLGVLPFFHIYGQTSIFNSSVYLGLTVRLWEHFEANEVFAAIQEEPSCILIAVPTIFNRLAEMAAEKPPTRSGLRFCVSGGASLPVEVLKRFEQSFGAVIYEG